MKKYFMSGTGKEIQFGDEIEMDMGHKLPNGKIKHQHLDCVFCPELVDTFLEKGIITTTPSKEEEEELLDILSLDDDSPEIELFKILSDRFKDIEDRLTDLEDALSKLTDKKASK